MGIEIEMDVHSKKYLNKAFKYRFKFGPFFGLGPVQEWANTQWKLKLKWMFIRKNI